MRQPKCSVKSARAIIWSVPSRRRGKIELTAACDGLLKIDTKALKGVNAFGQMMIATRHGNFAVKKGDKLAGTRIIPLVIEEEKMKTVKAQTMELTGGKPILELKPFHHKNVGIVTTGNEVFHGRIQDTFTPVIVDKLSEFDTEVIDHVTWDDDDKKGNCQHPRHDRKKEQIS